MQMRADTKKGPSGFPGGSFFFSSEARAYEDFFLEAFLALL
jgi:hypothetical protein